MTAAAEYAYTELRPLEKAKWFECLEFKLIGVEIANFLQSERFPTDIVYNWKRKYILLYEFTQAMKIILNEYSRTNMDWAKIRLLLYDEGLDADLYIRFCQKVNSISGQILHAIDISKILEFLFGNIDPKYDNEENPSNTAQAWKSFKGVKKIYSTASKKWTEKDMSKQMWTAVDASYEAHGHLKHWWASLGAENGTKKTSTERVFSNFKKNIQTNWQEKVHITKLHSKKPTLKVPVHTGIKSCKERDDPGWCTECAVVDNIIVQFIEQGQAIGWFYSERFPKIINNVSAYFNQLAEYNSEFFDGTFNRLQKSRDKVPKNSIRWTYHVARDWKDFISDFREYLYNDTHKEIWLGQVDKFLDASRQFVQSVDSEYVPFYGYSFYHIYNYIFFEKCDMEESIYVTTTTEEERLLRMDTAIITCALIILIIITNTTWSVVPLVWLANTVIIGFIVQYAYLYMVYGYFLNCIPVIPFTIMEDLNSWWHTRLNPGCFYKALPYIAIDASEDTCLTCAVRQEYINCANYTAANYESGMLPLSQLIEDYSFAWPFLFWLRWKWPSLAIFVVKNGILTFESTLGKLAMGAWQEEPIDPTWIDCYNAMWMDNILAGVFASLAIYITVKMSVILIQTAVQIGFLIMYIYTTLNYMSLAVEKSVVIN